MNEYLMLNEDYWSLETSIRARTFYAIQRQQGESDLSPVEIVGHSLGIIAVTNVFLGLPDLRILAVSSNGERQNIDVLAPLPPLSEGIANLAVNISNQSAQTLHDAAERGYSYGEVVDYGVRLHSLYRSMTEAGSSVVFSVNGTDWCRVVERSPEQPGT